MADMHVLTGDGDKWRVVMHFAVPDIDNAVGVAYRTALLNSGFGGATQMTEGSGPGQISAVEKAQIEAGEVLEHSMDVAVNGVGVTPAARLAELRIWYATGQVAVILELQRQLKFFGFTANEA